MSTAPSAAAVVEPKRQRGRLRVAAILQAAAELFAERGFDAATMTDIAARSGTAIGSLYRFFPNKDALAQALLTRYRDGLDGALAEIEQRAGELLPAAIADALLDSMLALMPDRNAAVILLETNSGVGDQRLAIRDMLLRRIAAILTAARMSPAGLSAVAMVVLQILKMAAPLASAQPGEPAGKAEVQALAELRVVLRLYLSARLSGDPR
ncbi:TetR/AcrR family transcriptional regulator [Lichenicola sp.]|uniref:TetR/AcrR family transcriptional regulator n=1 Tax=Lichenicola sp. TaxID=2804529 RepID=UPI003B007146